MRVKVGVAVLFALAVYTVMLSKCSGVLFAFVYVTVCA